MKKRTTLVLSLLMTASLLMTTGCGSSESTASDKTAETGAAEKAADRVAPRRQPPAQLLPFHAANVLLQKGEAAMIAFDGEEA